MQTPELLNYELVIQHPPPPPPPHRRTRCSVLGVPHPREIVQQTNHEWLAGELFKRFEPGRLAGGVGLCVPQNLRPRFKPPASYAVLGVPHCSYGVTKDCMAGRLVEGCNSNTTPPPKNNQPLGKKWCAQPLACSVDKSTLHYAPTNTL